MHAHIHRYKASFLIMSCSGADHVDVCVCMCVCVCLFVCWCVWVFGCGVCAKCICVCMVQLDDELEALKTLDELQEDLHEMGVYLEQRCVFVMCLCDVFAHTCTHAHPQPHIHTFTQHRWIQALHQQTFHCADVWRNQK